MAAPMQLIQDAVGQFILATPAPPLITVSNLFFRDMPEILDGDPSPCLIVTVLDERPPVVGGYKSNTSQYYDFPVYVLAARKVALSPRSDPWKKQIRSHLRQRLNTPYLVPGLTNRCAYNPQPEFSTNVAGLPIAWKVSPQLFVYRCEIAMDGTGTIYT